MSYPSCLFCFDLCCRVGGLGQWVVALALTGELQGKASLSFLLAGEAAPAEGGGHIR